MMKVTKDRVAELKVIANEMDTDAGLTKEDLAYIVTYMLNSSEQGFDADDVKGFCYAQYYEE